VNERRFRAVQGAGEASTMALLTWTPALSVGVGEIDEQHQQLIDHINDFYGAFTSTTARPDVGTLLDAMLGYTQYHFGTEEQLMQRYGYRERESHMAEHKAFVEKAVSFAARHKSGKPLLSVEVTSYLRDWVTSHIKGTDKKLGAFLASVGVG
jgi:hemerythrin